MDRRPATEAARGSATLLVLLVTMTGAVLALALRARHVVSELPSTQVEPHLELVALGVGALAATWIAASALLATVCVVTRAAGRSWSAGERLVVRVAPRVVRRAARVGVTVSVGAGLVLSGGTAQAADDPAPEPAAVVAVDLGWRPTATPDVPTAAQDPQGPPAVGTVPGTAAPGHDAGAVPAETEGARAGAGDTFDAAPADLPDSPTASRPPAAAPAPGTTAPPAATTARNQDAQRDAALAVTREVPTHSAPEVVVLRGDSLWSIASRHLPTGAADAQVAAAVQRWHATNADVIGADPDLILPGQVLRAPSA